MYITFLIYLAFCTSKLNDRVFYSTNYFLLIETTKMFVKILEEMFFEKTKKYSESRFFAVLNGVKPVFH